MALKIKNMQPKDFVYKYLTAANNSEKNLVKVINGVTCKVPSLVTLTQGAVESKWGDIAPGYNFFGVKDANGLKDGGQLLLTHEDLDNPNGKFPKVVNIIQVAQKIYRYTVYDYFRVYKTPEDAFNDHANFLLNNKRYAEALQQSDPIEVLKGIAAAGYATDPNYADLLVRVATMIKKYL